MPVPINAQKTFGVGVEIGAVNGNCLEYSFAEHFIKNRRNLNPSIRLSLFLKRKRLTYELTYRRFSQKVAFEISGPPVFDKSVGFGRVKSTIPLSSFEGVLAYEINKSRSKSINALLGVGLTLEMSEHSGAFQIHQDLVSTIEGVPTHLMYSQIQATSQYLKIPYILLGARYSKWLSTRSKLLLTVVGELDTKPLAAFEVDYQFKPPNFTTTVIGSRVLLLDSKRIGFSIGYAYMFSKVK